MSIPHGSLTVITGLSGSGKSSLAFDTIYAEGQRRYIETFSSYARNMLGSLERPDVDKITGLSPVIAIEQKTINRNPRSTIGTTTEVYDFLRLLYARIGQARSYLSGEPMVKFTEEKIVSMILDRYAGHKVYLLAPLVHNRKGHYKDLFEQLQKKGYLNVRVDGEMREITYGMKLDRYKNHSIELVVDKLKVNPKDLQRLRESVASAMRQGGKQMMVYDLDNSQTAHFSQELMDPTTGLSYREPAPHNFSFNSPLGACPRCKGAWCGQHHRCGQDHPRHKKSIYDGAIVPLGKYKNAMIFWQIAAICEKIRLRSENARVAAPRGGTQRHSQRHHRPPAGEIGNTLHLELFHVVRRTGEVHRDAADRRCLGRGAAMEREILFALRVSRMPWRQAQPRGIALFVDGKNIAELSRLDISDLWEWSKTVETRLDNRSRAIGSEILKEIRSRLAFLVDVGLGYLALNRNSATLSGGRASAYVWPRSSAPSL